MKNLKIKKGYTWNLKLLYKNDKDPQIEKDIKEIENLCMDFNKKYSKIDLNKKDNLLKSIKDFEILKEKISGSKPWWYFALKNDIEGENSYLTSQKTKIQDRLTKVDNLILFFTLNIANIDKKIQESILKDESFSRYKYFLNKIFKNAKYRLSEKEEKLENLLSQTSYDMWVNGSERLIKKQTIEFENENIPISKAMSIISDLDTEKRKELQLKINNKLKEISFFAEAEINAIFNYKKINDEIRGFKKPYSQTIIGYENEEKNIEKLVEMISSNFKISHRFYKLHKKITGLEKLYYQDKSVKLGEIEKSFSFDDSVNIVCSSFEKFDVKYKDMLMKFLSNGQIDVYPKIGKRGGAYCWGMAKMPTFLLLNHSENLRSVETLAHEMGHGIHTELSKNQPVFYRKYSIATAEVASTFFEQLVQDEIEKTLSDREKIIFLHNKILGDISTIFRQTACFNFENELHLKIRKEGNVPADEMAKLMTKHLKSYLGNSFDIKDDDGFNFVSWSHIRSFFYVYSYAYGQIISKALLYKWKKDNSFKTKIEEFLMAGKSDTPENIFKKIGINISKIDFFKDGLKTIEEDIARLEKMVK